MSAIDLDLVELRCRLRGWRYKRVESRGEGRPAYVEVLTEHDHQLMFSGVQYPESDRLRWLLTRPRLTLADIVASPPEGWRASRLIGCALDWFWSPPGGGAGCIVRIDGPLAVGQPTFFADDFEGRIAAHRAVAELLVLLGEVQS